MSSKSQAQQMMMGADLTRAKEGLPTKTGMSISKLKEFASTKRKNLPYKKSKRYGMGK